MDVGPLWIPRGGDDPLAPKHPSSPSLKPASQPEDPHEFQQEFAPEPDIDAALASEPMQPSSRQERPVAWNRAPTVAPDQPAKADSELQKKLEDAPWEAIASLISQCKACPALVKNRVRTVPADGAPGCPMVIVGEAPGFDEDLEGVPFVGKSGKLLTTILKSLGLERGRDVAIVNILKCRPPNNRNPRPDEMQACSMFLRRQLALLDPKVVVLAGRIAVKGILGDDEAENSLALLRNKPHSVTINGRTVPVRVTYHPAYLLRTPLDKSKVWRDFIAAKELMEGKA